MDMAVFAVILFNLFLIVDPVGCLPLFIVITKDNTKKERHKMILKAVIVAFLVLAFFALVGYHLLSYFGISRPAMQIAGGILLFVIGFEMLYGHVSKTESTEPEEKEAIEKQDISITPLAIPLLAGPGAITAVVLYSGIENSFIGSVTVVAAIAAVLIISWIILMLSDVTLKVMGQIGVKVVARVMGLLLIFMASQSVINGLTALGIAKALVVG